MRAYSSVVEFSAEVIDLAAFRRIEPQLAEPPAPAIVSTTNGLPSEAVSFSARTRDAMFATPPEL